MRANAFCGCCWSGSSWLVTRPQNPCVRFGLRNRNFELSLGGRVQVFQKRSEAFRQLSVQGKAPHEFLRGVDADDHAACLVPFFDGFFELAEWGQIAVPLCAYAICAG